MTPEGIERSRRAETKHGRYFYAAKLERLLLRTLLREGRETLQRLPTTRL